MRLAQTVRLRPHPLDDKMRRLLDQKSDLVSIGASRQSL